MVFTILVYLSIGPCLAIPRTASTSFQMLVPLIGGGTGLQLAYSVLFFAAAILVALRPEKLTDWLGRILCPCLIVLIVVMFAGCLIHPLAAHYGTPSAEYAALPAVQGMDLEKAGVVYDAETGIEVDDFLRTSNRRIFAAGDVCLEHAFTNMAEASAHIVVRNALLRGRQRLSALTVPWCTYTDPQVAHVGMYVRQAREEGIPVKTYTVPMHDVVRAITDGEEEGFVKIHVREGTDRILGATIVGRSAGELINNISLAMVAGLGLRRLAQVIHAYPTQGEAVRQAAQACVRSLDAVTTANDKEPHEN